jgi:hypothetical protein
MFRLRTRNWPPVSHNVGHESTLLPKYFTKSPSQSVPHSNAQSHLRQDRPDSIRMPALSSRAKAIYAFELEPSSRLSIWRDAYRSNSLYPLSFE